MGSLPDTFNYTHPSGKVVELLNYRRQPDLTFILLNPAPRDSRRSPGSLKKKRPMLVQRDGNLCHYCDNEMSHDRSKLPLPDNAATIEHIVPRAMGGPNSMDNLVLACNRCNHTMADTFIKCRCRRCGRARELYGSMEVSLG